MCMQVEAYRSNVVCPNKHREGDERFYKGRLLESETYIGGKVEAIESGVFRSDIPMHFNMQPEGYQYLIDRYVFSVPCVLCCIVLLLFFFRRLVFYGNKWA